MKDKVNDLIRADEDIDIEVLNKIKKGTRKNMLKSNVISIASVLLIIFVLNIIMQMIFYNPLKKADFSIDDTSEFEILMNVELGLKIPGYYYEMINGRNLGFSNYQIDGYFHDYNDFYLSVDNSDISVFLGNSKFSGVVPINYANRFVSVGSSDEYIVDWNYRQRKNDILLELEQLPSTSKFDVYVTFNEAIEISDVLEYGKDDYLIWIMCDIVNNHYFGVNPNDIFGYKFTDEFNQLYPGIEPYYDGKVTAEYLKNRYISSIRLLLANKQFINSLNQFSSYFNTYVLSQLLENSNSDIMAKGMRIIVGRDRLIDLMNDKNSYYIDIVDVRYSSFEIKN